MAARYEVRFVPKAERMYLKLPPHVQDRLRPKIDALAGNPWPPGAKKLTGAGGLYRIRVGDYRVIYAVQGRHLVVLVVAIGIRGSVYQRL